MKCPACKSTNHSVKETRDRENTVYRRRVCEICHHLWTTTEIIIHPKKHEMNEAKQLDKMIDSIRKYK